MMKDLDYVSAYAFLQNFQKKSIHLRQACVIFLCIDENNLV